MQSVSSSVIAHSYMKLHACAMIPRLLSAQMMQAEYHALGFVQIQASGGGKHVLGSGHSEGMSA